MTRPETMLAFCARTLLLAALAAGCSGRKPVAAAFEPPPPSEGMKLLPAWSARTNGVVSVAANFSKTHAARTITDIPLKCDLSFRTGIQFDFWCDDLTAFSSFSLYFKSGKGWYHGTFSPETSGSWQRVTVRKDETRTESTPAGWNAITQIRISGWRAHDVDARFALANVAYLGGENPDVAIIYAGTLANKGGADGNAYVDFAGRIASTLESLGLNCPLVADCDLKAEMLASVPAAVLPYNTSFPSDKLPLLKDFVESGRRIFACYSLPPEIARLLGVRLKGVVRPDKPISGFLKAGAGLPGQPVFAPQASWITQRVEIPPFGGEVLATWAAGDKTSLGLPALVRTPAGVLMAHVWLGGVEGASVDLMRSIMTDIAPSLASKMEAHSAALKKKQDEDRKWLETQSPKAGEHRAFWCHSARGLGGGLSWDDSIRYLKGNGFNAIMANLAWGGAAFYRSDVLPPAADVAKQGDALDACLAACRKHGVQCHVWKVCWNMGYCAPSKFVEAMSASNRTQVAFNGTKKTSWLCPSNPDNQNMEIEAMVELAKRGVDGVHFDYIRYPNIDHCFCEGCRARFEAVAGPVAGWPGAIRKDDRLRKLWQDFRSSNIAFVVSAVASRVRAETPGVKLSAAVFQNDDTAPVNVGQDWVAWVRSGWLDFVCPMNYLESTALFKSLVSHQMKVVGRSRIYPGIGLSCWRNDGQEAVRLARQILAVRELGADGFTVFNFDRRAEKVLPLLHLGVTRD